MDTGHLELADLPQLTAAFERGPFFDYSVGLGRVRDQKLTSLGSGVLVKKGGRCGILTARHCLHACTPKVSLGPSGCDELYLVLRRGDPVRAQPLEVVERGLATPQSEEFGPDLTFIEVLAVQRRASLEAIGSFCSLDGPLGEIEKDFGGVGTPTVSVGFPEDHNTQRAEGGTVRLRVAAMLLGPSVIESGDTSENAGWDYIESHFSDPVSGRSPASLKGFSGGPVWGLKLRKHKTDGHISIERHALIGINFYEIGGQNEERRMRAHFIKSIYEVACKNLVC